MPRRNPLKVKISAIIVKTKTARKNGKNLGDKDITVSSLEEFKKKVFKEYSSHIAGKVTFMEIEGKTAPVLEKTAQKERSVEEFGDYIRFPIKNKKVATLKDCTATFYDELTENRKLAIKILQYGPNVDQNDVNQIESAQVNTPEVNTPPKVNTPPRVNTSPQVNTTPKVNASPQVNTPPKVNTPPRVNTSPQDKTTPKINASPQVNTPPQVNTSPQVEREEIAKKLKEKFGRTLAAKIDTAWSMWASLVIEKNTEEERNAILAHLPVNLVNFFTPTRPNDLSEFLNSRRKSNEGTLKMLDSVENLLERQIEDLKKQKEAIVVYKSLVESSIENNDFASSLAFPPMTFT